MTTQRKIFAALLALAALAFAVDHWWLGPTATRAEAPAEAPTIAPAPTHAPPTRRRGNESARGSLAKGKPAPDRTLAARLLEAARADPVAPDGARETSAVPDAFRPSSLWYPAAARAARAPPVAPVISPETIAAFRSRHRLTAVMKSSRPASDGSAGGIAIIGGRVYVPGQVIDGFTLVSLGDRTAQLTCRGVSIQLAIDPPDALSSLSGQ